MSDAALTTPKDSIATTAALTDAQVGNAVATKFLTEVNTALTGPKNDLGTEVAPLNASKDLSDLQGDPQQKAVLSAIAQKITDHDPSLGIVQGTVERDPSGEITGFSFANPQQEQTYQASLNAYEQQGYTQQEAIANIGPSGFNQAELTGQLEIPAIGNPAPTPPANTGEGNGTGISVNGQW